MGIGMGEICAYKRRNLATAFARQSAIVLGSVALGTVTFHAVLLARDAGSNYRLSLMARAREGALQLADAGQTSGAFRSWAWSIMQDENIVGAAICDADGRHVEVVPPDTQWLKELSRAPHPDSTVRVTVEVEGEPRTLWCAPAPIGDLTNQDAVWVVVVGRNRPLLKLALRPITRAALVTFAAGALGWWALNRSFKRRIAAPLALVAGVEPDAEGPLPPGFPLERPDEIGELARALERTRARLAESREQAARLEQSVHWRVADRTRQINAQLRRAERAAWVDPLSGLGNRRLLEDRLEEIFNEQRDEGGDLSVVMMDLDRFKQLNDTQGHAAGDEMLRFVGELLKGALRPADLGVRYGGDEFALILPDTSPGQAAHIAERIVRLFQQRSSLLGLDPPMSLSAGIASLKHDQPESGRQLLDLADQALYAAKTEGREVLCARKPLTIAQPG